VGYANYELVEAARKRQRRDLPGRRSGTTSASSTAKMMLAKPS